MKKITGILMMALLMTASIAIAQPGPGGERLSPEERAARHTSRLVGELELDEDQALQVEELNLHFAEEMMSLRGEARGDREAMRERMQAIQAERNEEFQAILSEDQYTRFLELEEEARNRMRDRRGGRQGGPQGPPPAPEGKG